MTVPPPPGVTIDDDGNVVVDLSVVCCHYGYEPTLLNQRMFAKAVYEAARIAGLDVANKIKEPEK
jgi:hypothetical protein